jgi:two-component system alkaline phosphatase synthesis response regulator PhoP
MAMKPKVLIVDDEKNVTAVIRAYLDATGIYETETANSGQEGLEKARLFHPDLILLDVMMPDFGGDVFADKAKKDPVLRNVPIVFLTGIVTKEEVKASGGTIGGFAYLAKPVTRSEELTSCIEAHLRSRGA